MSAKVKTFLSGQILFKEGEASRHMYLIQKGTVSIRKAKGNSHVELARAFPNQVIGEISFFDRQPRSATAMALNDVEVIEISFQSLDELYTQVPPYFKTIMGCVADRLRKASESIRRLEKSGTDTAVHPPAQETQTSASILESLADVPANPSYLFNKPNG